MYYHWNSYVRRLSLLSDFEDTPVVPSFLVGGNHTLTVGSLKNDMDFYLKKCSCFLISCRLLPSYILLDPV
jgi:hypothetical protein